MAIKTISAYQYINELVDDVLSPAGLNKPEGNFRKMSHIFRYIPSAMTAHYSNLLKDNELPMAAFYRIARTVYHTTGDDFQQKCLEMALPMVRVYLVNQAIDDLLQFVAIEGHKVFKARIEDRKDLERLEFHSSLTYLERLKFHVTQCISPSETLETKQTTLPWNEHVLIDDYQSELRQQELKFKEEWKKSANLSDSDRETRQYDQYDVVD